MTPTIEQAAELHEALTRDMYPLCYSQRINPGTFHAVNQPSNALVFSTRISPWPITRFLKERRRTFDQGIGCIEITITARWGGAHHDGTPRNSTEVDVQISDRTRGGSTDNFKWYGTTPNALNEPVAFGDVLDLVRSLTEKAKALPTGQAILAEMNELLQTMPQEGYNLERDGLESDIETFTRLELL